MGRTKHLLEPGGHQFATPALHSMYKVIFIVMEIMLLYIVGVVILQVPLYLSELSFIVEAIPPPQKKKN